MRLGRSVVLVALACWAAAETGITVDSLVAAVRSSLARKRKDPELAATLGKMTLAQRLDDRVIEILESEGAGPQALGALQRLRDGSRLLPAPPDPPPGMEPPPPLTLDEERREWESAGRRAMEYTRSLPDFVCTETIHRWTDPAGRENWQPTPTVVAALTFFDRKEDYKLLTVGGKASKQSLADLSGAVSQGEFGTMLAIIFDPRSDTDRRWDHWTTLRTRLTSVYFFRVAIAHRPRVLRYRNGAGADLAAVAGEHGFVYIDRETNGVTRISADAEEVPAGFPVQRSTSVLDYDYADIGGQRFLLPLRAEIRIDAGPVESLNSVEFQKYRKFGADTKVSFGDGK